MEITIKKMGPDDLNEVLAVLEKWNMAPLQPTPEIPDPERSSIHIENSFVATDGGKVVGVASYILLSQVSAETASLAVDPAYNGRGIGYMLQMARLREMKARGINRVQTETDRPQTIRWYVEKFGYRIVGTNRKKHAFSLPNVDFWTVLELDLENFKFKGTASEAEPRR